MKYLAPDGAISEDGVIFTNCILTFHARGLCNEEINLPTWQLDIISILMTPTSQMFAEFQHNQ